MIQSLLSLGVKDDEKTRMEESWELRMFFILQHKIEVQRWRLLSCFYGLQKRNDRPRNGLTFVSHSKSFGEKRGGADSPCSLLMEAFKRLLPKSSIENKYKNERKRVIWQRDSLAGHMSKWTEY